jgi:peptidoglycan/LPS O-acetylase OafA/YrhL
VIIAFVIFYICHNKKASLLDNALLRYVAGYSYAWFLIHQNVGMVIEFNLRKHYSIPLQMCIVAAMTVTFCLAVFITKADGLIMRELANKNK